MRNTARAGWTSNVPVYNEVAMKKLTVRVAKTLATESGVFIMVWLAFQFVRR